MAGPTDGSGVDIFHCSHAGSGSRVHRLRFELCRMGKKLTGKTTLRWIGRALRDFWPPFGRNLVAQPVGRTPPTFRPGDFDLVGSAALCSPIPVGPKSPRRSFLGTERIHQSGSRDAFLAGSFTSHFATEPQSRRFTYERHCSGNQRSDPRFGAFTAVNELRWQSTPVRSSACWVPTGQGRPPRSRCSPRC